MAEDKDVQDEGRDENAEAKDKGSTSPGSARLGRRQPPTAKADAEAAGDQEGDEEGRRQQELLARQLGKLLTQASASSTPQATPDFDKTIKGGYYIENEVAVDAWGRKIEDPDEGSGLLSGPRSPGHPTGAVPSQAGRQPASPEGSARKLPK